MSVYLSVAPPDGFTRWSAPDWDRWLRDHPWEAAERICSTGDWAIFFYQLRANSVRGRKLIEPHLDALVNERPLETQACDDVLSGLRLAREELAQIPAARLVEQNNEFVAAEDLQSMIAAAQNRVQHAPSCADVWADLFARVIAIFESAEKQKRGVYFGNV